MILGADTCTLNSKKVLSINIHGNIIMASAGGSWNLESKKKGLDSRCHPSEILNYVCQSTNCSVCAVPAQGPSESFWLEQTEETVGGSCDIEEEEGENREWCHVCGPSRIIESLSLSRYH